MSDTCRRGWVLDCEIKGTETPFHGKGKLTDEIINSLFFVNRKSLEHEINLEVLQFSEGASGINEVLEHFSLNEGVYVNLAVHNKRTNRVFVGQVLRQVNLEKQAESN